MDAFGAADEQWARGGRGVRYASAQGQGAGLVRNNVISRNSIYYEPLWGPAEGGRGPDCLQTLTVNVLHALKSLTSRKRSSPLFHTELYYNMKTAKLF